MRIFKISRPVAHCFIYRIFQRAASCCNGTHFCTVKFHCGNVRLLAAHVYFTHIYNTFKTKFSAGGSSCKTVLTGTCFGDNARFSHFLCKKALTYCIVDFMCACIRKTFKFYVNLCAAKKFCCCRSKIKRRFAPDIITLDYAQFFQKRLVVHIKMKRLCKFIQRTAQNFRNIFSAVLIKKSVC